MRTGTLCLFLAVLAPACGDEPQPPKLTAEEQKLLDVASTLNRDGLQLARQNQIAPALAKLRRALELVQEVFPRSKYPDGNSRVAQALNNLAYVTYSTGQLSESAKLHQQALAMRRKLYPAAKYPDGHEELATSMNNVAFILQSMGDLAKAEPLFDECLAMRRKLYSKEKYPDGHPLLALSLNNVGVLLSAKGQHAKALPYYQDSLEMYRKHYPKERYPKGHLDLARQLNNLGDVCKQLGQYEKGLENFEQALAMYRDLYPKDRFPLGHPDLAVSLNNMGFVLSAMARYEQAIAFYGQAVDMYRKAFPKPFFPNGHPLLAKGLSNLATTHAAMGRQDQALPVFEEVLDMFRKQFPEARYPNGHPDLAQGLGNLAMAYHATGQLDRALVRYEESLAMYRKTYSKEKFPDGHPHMALTLSSIGAIHRQMRQFAKALEFAQQAMDMLRKCYPESKYQNGHVELVAGLNELGGLMADMEKFDKALEYFEQYVTVARKLYPAATFPDGHAQIASGLNNIGGIHLMAGREEEGLRFAEQSMAMTRKLYPLARYPNGHPTLALNINNFGLVMLSAHRPDRARPLLEESMAMQRKLLQQELLTASEAAAMERFAIEPSLRYPYLSATRSREIPATESYAAIWPSRSMITRMLQRRHAGARSGNTALAAKTDRLQGNRRRTEQLLQDIRLPRDERDKILADLADERDNLEREIATALPVLDRWRELDRLGPDDLAKALPDGAVFIDLIAYDLFEQDPNKKGRAGQKRIPSYVAFVLAKNKPIVRVELGHAVPIDEAVAEWRTAIEGRKDEVASERIRDLVWRKIAAELPSETRLIYLAAEGDLACIPWSALPIAKNRVLLEDYALAQVPHGPYLLEQLKYPPAFDDAGSSLTLGDVDYGTSEWAALPGAKLEVTAIAALASGESTSLIGLEATSDKLITVLSKSRYAHLATHGQFQAKGLAEERKRARKALEEHQFGDQPRRQAAQNPLGFVGLVLAKGEVISGLSIVDLPLEQLKLVTLSACETGLGDLTGGEGVQGLQRAFHLAGCSNVVASLWKVNDAATAALMAKFYHEMWQNNRPPIEALREAQLTIYRHPELIPDLAGQRGAPSLKKAVGVKSAALPPKDTNRKRADTRLWAAFVLSGTGR